jgi:hypothetical protein
MIIPLSNYLKNLPQTKTSPKKIFDLGLPAKKPAKILDLSSFLRGTKTTTPITTETGGPIEFIKGAGQSIARSFIATGASLWGAKHLPFGEETYTPIGKTEQRIFGTDKPISLKTIGEETLMIGGEDFKNKWGKYAVPVGTIIAGLDIIPIGAGKKDALKIASKAIAETDDVVRIAKALKPIFKGVDEEINVLAKSLKLVNKEDDVLKIIQQVGKSKEATPIAQKAIKEAIPAGKAIIPEELEPLAVEARKYGSVEEFDRGIRKDLDTSLSGISQTEKTRLMNLRESFKNWKISELDKGKIPQLTNFYNQAVKGIKEVKPEVKPVQTAVQKLTQALKESGPVRKEQEALYSAERARRTARVVAMGEKVPGEKGFFAQLGQLKGSLPKAKFEAIRSKFFQTEVDSLFDLVEKAKILPFEKISVKTGLAGLFEGRIPTKSELELFNEVFPKELVEEILNKRPFSQKLFGALGQIINTPRAIMASVDLSAPLRQGIFLIGRPKQFLQSFGNMFKYAFSEKAYVGLEQSIKSRPTYELMRKAKIAFTGLGSALTSREEVIMANLPERIPFLGKVFRGSNRAYTGFLNKLRADVFDDIVRKAQITGKKLTDTELEGLGKFINAATGRGDIGQLQKASSVLNAAFFSPRLMASRINLLNPYFYATLSPIARKEALKSLFSFAGITGSILGLAKIGGVDVGVDPRSADFGKIKIGNTRYDILGGFQQYLRLAGQLLTGEIVSSTTGRTMTLGEGYKPLTRKDILLRFFENKTSPIASFIIGLMTGTTGVGEDFDLPTEVINRFIPMVVQDMYDLTQEEGAEGILMGLPAIFGAGVQTYGKQELKFGESTIGEPTAQIKSAQGLGEKIRELVLGQLPLGSSKGFSVESYFDQLSNLPREEAADIFNKISEANPDLAKKLSDVVKERELGITVKDKDLKSKGIASGDRALAVKKELDNLKTKEEKATLWNDYTKKGIITKEVARQLMILLKK